MKRTIAPSLIRMLLVVLAAWGNGDRATAGQSLEDDRSERFRKVPRGWTLTKSFLVPDRELPTFSSNLGGQFVRISNTVLSVDGQPLRVNIFTCKTVDDALKRQAKLLRLH